MSETTSNSKPVAVYELITHGEGETDDSSYLGGLPPLGARAWPCDEDGVPFTHVGTFRVETLGAEVSAVAVFAAVDDREERFAGNELPMPVLLLDELGEEVQAPAGAQVLSRRPLKRRRIAEVKAGGDSVEVHFTEDDQRETFDELEEALGEILEASRGSISGGWAYNPSIFLDDEDRERQDAARGAFVAQLSGALFGGEVDFCGGGWLFVHRNGAWAEQ